MNFLEALNKHPVNCTKSISREKKIEQVMFDVQEFQLEVKEALQVEGA